MKMLIVVPHPDDEVYGASGTILDFVQAGDQVGLVTLTQGEGGRSLGLADGREALAALRAGPEGELQAALAVLGVQVHHQHTFPDGKLNEVPASEIVPLIQGYVRQYQPEIVLTFAPNGSNGHRDHIATHHLVYQALEELNRPCALWYYAMHLTDHIELSEELQALHLEANIERDVSQHIAPKLRAIAMHRSQALSTVDFFRRHAERIPVETFHQAYPPLDDEMSEW